MGVKGTMSKLIEEDIQVEESAGRPAAFRWRRRFYKVAHIAAEWHETGRWWEGEAERLYLRAIAHNGGAYDLCFDQEARRWRLHVVHD
jgi:hypothetical protein